MKSRSAHRFLLFGIFAINFLSLVYQVVWTRKITVIFGTTALSVSTTLTVFLSGIALGGWLGGRLIRKVEAPYRLCGVALLFLGLYAMASSHLFALIRHPFLFFAGVIEDPFLLNIMKFVFCTLILILPTTIIGAMFPAVTYLYNREFRRLGSDVASIYSHDTLGAALGAIVCGFLLVPVVGLYLTTIFSGLVYVLLGLVMLLYERGRGPAQVPEASPEEDGRPSAGTGVEGIRLFVVAALFLSGFSALVLEVTWSRYFHLILGTSIYAFALVVAAFLLGLSLGSVMIRRFMDRIRNPLLLFAFLEILIAGLSFAVIQTSGLLETIYFRLFHSMNNFFVFQVALFVIAFLIMLLPTALVGANFPLAVKIFARGSDTRGEDSGLIFSVNTAGGIFGAFVAGFFLIPHMGLEDTSILSSVIYLVIGFLFLLLSAPGPAYYAMVSTLALAFVSFGYINYGEPPIYASVYYNGIRFKSLERYRLSKKINRTLYAKHGLYGLVSVQYDPVLKALVLLNNGKVDASTTRKDMELQELLGHIPLFFHKDPRRVLNIGLGSGITVSAITSHSDVKKVDCVEIDPLVVEAASRYFARFNNNAMGDPRVEVYNDDGRHFLYTARKKYDVVVSEPPNIWVSGVSQLFTREFYRIVDEHLNDGGILAQWVPAYEMERDDIRLIINTLRERFSHVCYWTNKVDVVILASHSPLAVDAERVRRLMNVPRVSLEVRKGLPQADADFMTRLLLNPSFSPRNYKTFLSGFDQVNTDDLPLLEFKTARNIFNKAHHL